MLDIVECPRDAMQGIKHHIPTGTKIDYINTLLKVGFHTIDFGSFVSPKAIPQMADTAEVIKGLDRKRSRSKLLAIVANARGASDAALYEEVDILGYPFSISEQFQLRNTNATIEDSLGRVEEISSICAKNKKELVLYVSMAFGNPYGEKWHPDVAIYWTKRLYDEFGVKVIALSDTIGSSNVQSIDALFSALIPELPEVRFGAHLHTTPDSWREKVNAAYMAGCRRFDGAIKGFGGCPMADDELTGNMPTEKLLEYAAEKGVETGINQNLFDAAMLQAATVFP
jgi:hydroxymethylglutaryl-CoA lyase